MKELAYIPLLMFLGAVGYSVWKNQTTVNAHHGGADDRGEKLIFGTLIENS